MDLVIMGVALKMANSLLPVGCQYILVLASQALMNLSRVVSYNDAQQGIPILRLGERGKHTLAQGPVYSSAGAKP